TTRSGPRVAALRARTGHRAVHQRSRLHPIGRTAGPRRSARRAAAATHCGGVARTALDCPDLSRTNPEQSPVTASTCGGRDIPRHLLATVDHLAQPRLAPGPHAAA